MSLKRILGTVLASRLAGRGRRRRGGLGSSALLGGMGYRRRPALRGKAGLAALGFMAYRAYRDHQARNPGTAGVQTAGTGATQTDGGIGGMVNKLVDTISGATSSTATEAEEPSAAELREDEQAAENLSDAKALLLIRAMITAAYSDGALSSEERERIMGEIAEAGGDAEDRQVMEREIANPKPLDELLRDVQDKETAEEFYLASAAAVDGETEANRSYLETLRQRLDISEEEAREVEELTA
ncbi:tellurite resistance TerB family protein [Palleronia aestuarii]|nr:DUF533 domain-containing protein [Palleronia aestuarii]